MLARIRGTLKKAYVLRAAGGCGTAAGSSLFGCRKIPVGTVVMKRGRRCMLSPLLLCVCVDYREQYEFYNALRISVIRNYTI